MVQFLTSHTRIALMEWACVLLLYLLGFATMVLLDMLFTADDEEPIFVKRGWGERLFAWIEQPTRFDKYARAVDAWTQTRKGGAILMAALVIALVLFYRYSKQIEETWHLLRRSG